MEKRIRKHFSRELENIKKLILSLGAIVEERVRMATKAIEDNDAELAQQIIKSDFILRYIDDLELRQAIEKQLNKMKIEISRLNSQIDAFEGKEDDEEIELLREENERLQNLILEKASNISLSCGVNLSISLPVSLNLATSAKLY